MKRSTVLVVAVVAALGLSACTHDNTTSPTTRVGGPAVPMTVYTLKVLEPVVGRVIAGYKAAGHPAAKITVTALKKPGLERFIAGKKVGVAVATDNILSGGDQRLHAFGRIVAVILVPAANPKKITDLKSFSAKGLKVAICGPNSKYGNLAAAPLYNAKLTFDPKTVSTTCKPKAAERIASGELDAALLFRHGLKLPAGVKMVNIPDKQNVVIKLSYVTVGNSVGANDLANWIVSPKGRTLLTQDGYLP